MATHPDLNTDAHFCDVADLRDFGQFLFAGLRVGIATGGGVERSSSFLIPHSSFTTRQSIALAWRQAR